MSEMLTYDDVRAFLYREARYLDDRDWDQWLNLYTEDCTYWMPAWDEDGQLTRDPQSEISLMWYGRRAGLEDRVFRIRTGRSSATEAPTRTTHQTTNIEILDQKGPLCYVRHNFLTLVVRYNELQQVCGTTFCTLRTERGSTKIQAKKIVLHTDYIRHIVDVYHV